MQKMKWSKIWDFQIVEVVEIVEVVVYATFFLHFESFYGFRFFFETEFFLQNNNTVDSGIFYKIVQYGLFSIIAHSMRCEKFVSM